MGKSVRVSKGNEVLEIPDTDLQDAVKDGYLPTERVIVHNTKTNETFEVDPKDLPHAFSDGFTFSSVKKKDGLPVSQVASMVGPNTSHTKLPSKEDVNPSKYETKLNPQQENRFKSWFEDQHKKGAIQQGDYDFYKKNGYGYDYDFRAAFLNGENAAANGHWSDIGKKPNHETFSNESKYNGIDGYIGGKWEGNNFVSPKSKSNISKVAEGAATNQEKQEQNFWQNNDDPVSTILTPLKQNADKASLDFDQYRNNEFFHSEAPIAPNKGQQMRNEEMWNNYTSTKNKEQEAQKNYSHTLGYLSANLFPTATEANNYIHKKAVQNGGKIPDNNQTVKLASARVNDFNNVADVVHQNGNLINASVEYARKNNPDLDAKLKAIEKEHHDLKNQLTDYNQQYDAYRKLLGDATMGRIVSEFVSDPNVKEFVGSGTNPISYGEEYQDLKDNALTKFKDYGINVVANEVSRKRQELGMNSKVANFNTASFNKKTDELAEQMYKGDPKKLQIYNDYIRDEKKKYLSTPSFLNAFESAIERGFHGTVGSIKDLSLVDNTTQGEDLQEELNKEATSVSAGEKGLHKNLVTMGDFAGTIAYIAGGGNVLKGVGVPANIADKTMTGLTFYHDQLRQAENKYPDNPTKAKLSAFANTGAFMVLSDIFPSGKVSKALGEIKPEVENVIKQLDNKTIASATAKDMISKVVGKTITQYGKGVAENGALTVFNQSLDKVLGLNKETYDAYHPDDELADTIKTAALGNIIPSAIIGRGEYAQRNFSKDAIFEMATDKKRYERVLQDMKEADPKMADEIDQKISNLNFLSNTNDALDKSGEELSDSQKKQYLLHSLNEKILQEKADNIQEPKLKEKITTQIDRSRQIKDAIFKGDTTNADVLPQENKSEPTENQKVIQKAIDEGEISGIMSDAAKEALSHPDKTDSFLKEVADQALNKVASHTGTDEGQRKAAEGLFGKSVVERAIELYPKEIKNETSQNNEPAEAQSTPITETNQNIGSAEKSQEFSQFKEHILNDISNVKSSAFDWAIDELPLSKADRDRGIRDLHNGKDSKAAQTITAAIEKMYRDGFVYLNRGRGNQTERIAIPIKDYMAEVNKPFEPERDLDELNTMLGEDSFNETFDNHYNDIVNEKERTGEANETPTTPTESTTGINPQTSSGEGAPNPTKEPPTAEKIGAAIGEDDGNKVGVSHDSLSNLADKLGLKEPERGDILTPEQYANRGRALINAGADPIQIGKEFKENGKVSPDIISVARAHTEDLVRALNAAGDKLGTNSDQYKKALSDYQTWRDEVMKPMGTKAGETFTSLQGERDIDTGSFTAIKRAVEEAQNDKPLSAAQEKTARELSDKVKSLSNEVDTLKKKLTEALDREVQNEKKEKSKKYTDKAKSVANRFRKLKTKPFKFRDENGNEYDVQQLGITWNDLVEAGAKVIEKTGEIADGIAEVIEKVKDTDWYKGFSDKDKERFANQLSEHYKAQADEPVSLAERFADKKDNKFTPEDAKEVWDYAKTEYLDKGVDFDDMISGIGMDLGLTTTQVRDAITTPKGSKPIMDAMYLKQNARNNARRYAEDWARAAGTPRLVKLFSGVPRFFFGLKVFGHGTVGFLTHAGTNIFDPVEAKRYWPIFFKQFQFAYGKTADYEKAMQDMQRDPQYLFWKRNGLSVDPSERYDDYQFVSKFLNKIPVLGKLQKAGDRGFNALKVYRLARAKALYSGLSNIEKADPNTAKQIATLVNHSTGSANVPLPEAASVVFFAAHLEGSRWNRLLVDPAKAVKTFYDWNNSTPAEKVAAKIVAKRAGRILGTYIGALVTNQAILSISGSKQKINFLNPTDPDWLKFKAGDRTMDLTGGMVSLLGFLTRMTIIATESKKAVGNKPRKDQLMSSAWNYATGKFSPFASTVKDLATHHDFQGNTMPFSNDKPASGKHKLTWGEYLKNQQTPIPISEAFNDAQKQMEAQGLSKPSTNIVLGAILTGLAAGGVGMKVGEEPHSRPTPFNENDNKDATFKFFLDKGMELPNTSPASEEIKDEDTHTIKALSEYPKSVQDNYMNVHKEYLKEELDDMMSKGYVYINPYGEVSKHHSKGAERKDFNELNEKELAEVLHIAQSQATVKTKKELFKN